MDTKQIQRNRGFHDAKNAATLAKPFHSNWKRDEAGNLQHFDADYLEGYKAGWFEAKGETL